LFARRPAFTLAEALMASTILAIAVIGVSVPLSAAHQQASAVRDQNMALLLARQLVEEIASKPLCDQGATCHPGPEAGETDRSRFDSADDYHGYSDSTENLKDLGGHSVPFGSGLSFRREVTVEYRKGPSGPPACPADYALVTVRVTAPGGYSVKLARLMTRQVVTY
jgi:hypothetical protein